MANKMNVKQLLDQRMEECRGLFGNLLCCEQFAFDNLLHSSLPELHGIYAISLRGNPIGVCLRAGRTKDGKGGLRQRIYLNHFMGNQKGNLREQLVRIGTCADIEQAKTWIMDHCVVQFVVIQEPDLRKWTEYYMLAVLRPKCCD